MRSRRALLAVFVLTVLVQLALHQRSTLYDTDSHLHLAVGELYAQQGIPQDLEFARFSLMHEGFGDKEWLFHAALGSLSRWLEPLTAGRLALALLNAFIAVVLAALARSAVGRWGLLLPFVLPLLSTEFFWRSVRLRPELLALPLFLCALTLLADRRPRLLGLVMLLLTASYTAFHAFLGVVLLVWAVLEYLQHRSELQGAPNRPIAWPLAIYATLGCATGLVLHPHFPHNLSIWLVQNVQFFLAKASLDVGTEIRPNTTDVMLWANLGLWLSLGALACYAVVAGRARQASEVDDSLRRRARSFQLAAFVFTLLYLNMSRFALYAMPLLALAVLYEVALRTTGGGSESRGGNGARKLSWTLAIAVLIAVPGAWPQLGTYWQRTHPGPDQARVKEWRALSEAIPDAARVAADWRSTGILALWAPQGRYLNILDPVFMATPFPQRHAALRRVLSGDEPDVPSAVTGALDSEYLLIRTVGADRRLLARLENDPRIRIAYRGSYVLAHFAGSDALFVQDGWQGVNGTSGPSYASPGDGSRRPYVNGEDFSFNGACMTVATTVEQQASNALILELSPRGQTSVWVDGEPRGSVAPGVDAVLGRGLVLPLEPPETTVQRAIRVLTCRPERGEAPGFYLLAGSPG